MIRSIAAILIASAVCGLLAADLPSFEVASIKPAAPPKDMNGRMAFGGGPGSNDPGRINYPNVNLKLLLARAYEVKMYQISGPGWLDSERFDVMAKVPAGTSKEQIPLMLQALLAERFKLKLHRETKELPMYSLVIGKNGPKLKESPPEENVKEGNNPSPGVLTAPPPPPPPGGPGRGGFTMGKDGFPQLPPGRRGTMMMMSPGRAHMAANRTSMESLAGMLTGQLDRPVFDMTELKGNYDFSLDWAPDGQGMMGRMGLGGMLPPPPGAVEAPLAPAGDGPAAASIFTAVQEQLGLKLEPRKGPVEMLVIDHMEKTPTDN